MQYLLNKYKQGIKNSRTGIVVKNMMFSVTLKMVSISLSFLMVPITLSYLTKTNYGLWIALSSVLAWFFIFDVGVGNGLKNKYIELKAQNKISEIKCYVSTAYFIFTLISLIIVGVFLIFVRFVNWTQLLKAPVSSYFELRTTATIVFLSLCLTFVLRLINTILQADLKTGLSDSIGVISYSFSFIGVYILSKYANPSLISFAIVTSGANICITLISSIILFKTIYQNISPNFKYIRLDLIKNLVVVGINFFIIQIGSLVLFQTTSLILSNLVGPDAVADYSITSKYYSIASMAFIMLTQPLWTGYGDAYYKNDFHWIRLTFKRLKKLWIILLFLMLVMILSQKVIFHYWLHDRIRINYTMSFLFIIFYSLQMWANIYEPFINSTSKLKLQLYLVIAIIPFFIPFSIYLVKSVGLGPIGILISIILLNGIPSVIFSTIQSNKILLNKPGIWNK